jgi:hypothetical protein
VKGTTAIAVFLAVFWLLPVIVGGRIGDAKNRRGWVWGLFLGWLGVIILLCLPWEPTAEERELAKLEQQLRIQKLRKELNAD